MAPWLGQFISDFPRLAGFDQGTACGVAIACLLIGTPAPRCRCLDISIGQRTVRCRLDSTSFLVEPCFFFLQHSVEYGEDIPMAYILTMMHCNLKRLWAPHVTAFSVSFCYRPRPRLRSLHPMDQIPRCVLPRLRVQYSTGCSPRHMLCNPTEPSPCSAKPGPKRERRS